MVSSTIELQNLVIWNRLQTPVGINISFTMVSGLQYLIHDIAIAKSIVVRKKLLFSIYSPSK
jgi:hypothetical protein